MRKQIFNYIRLMIVVSLIFANVPSVQAEQILVPPMPKPGTIVNLSPAFTPAHLKGMTVHPENALQFDFLMDKGESNLNDADKKQEYTKIIKYFLSSLTIADKDQWVNLSPYESGRIIENNFGKTEMGRDLLAQDYLLKQVTSSLMYPESGLGKKFWDKVYERAFKEFGHTNVPVNTINKVWIMPDEAVVYESKNTALILKSHLKVMLEEDYLAVQKNKIMSPSNVSIGGPGSSASGFPIKALGNDNKNNTNDIIRQIILPELEKEINEGKNFAQLRQIVSAMILATWYKQALKESLLGKVYADKAKVKGVELMSSPKSSIGDPESIYQQYLAAFKKGVYSYIKDDEDKYTQQRIPRKYFSGGYNNAMLSKILKVIPGIFQRGSGHYKPIDASKSENVKVILSADMKSKSESKIESSTIVNVQSLDLGLIEHFDPDQLAKIYEDIQAGGDVAPVLIELDTLVRLASKGEDFKYESLSPEASFEEISVQTNWGGIPDDVGIDYNKEVYEVDANVLRQSYEENVDSYGRFVMLYNVKSQRIYPVEHKFISRFKSLPDWIALRLGHDDDGNFKIKQINDERKFPKKEVDSQEQSYIDTYIARINQVFDTNPELNPQHYKDKEVEIDRMRKSVEAVIRGVSQRDLEQETIHPTDILLQFTSFSLPNEVLDYRNKYGLAVSKNLSGQLNGHFRLEQIFEGLYLNKHYRDMVSLVLLGLQMESMIEISYLREYDPQEKFKQGLIADEIFRELDESVYKGAVKVRDGVNYQVLMDQLRVLIDEVLANDPMSRKEDIFSRMSDLFSGTLVVNIDFAMNSQDSLPTISQKMNSWPGALASSEETIVKDSLQIATSMFNEYKNAKKTFNGEVNVVIDLDTKTVFYYKGQDLYDLRSGVSEKIKSSTRDLQIKTGTWRRAKLVNSNGTLVLVMMKRDGQTVDTKNDQNGDIKDINKVLHILSQNNPTIVNNVGRSFVDMIRKAIGLKPKAINSKDLLLHDLELYVREQSIKLSLFRNTSISVDDTPVLVVVSGIGFTNNYRITRNEGSIQIYSIIDGVEKLIPDADKALHRRDFDNSDIHPDQIFVRKMASDILLKLKILGFIDIDNNQNVRLSKNFSSTRALDELRNADIQNSSFGKVMGDSLIMMKMVRSVISQLATLKNYDQNGVAISSYIDGFENTDPSYVEIELREGAKEVELRVARPISHYVNEFQSSKDLGGIDLNSENFNLNIKRDGNGVVLPLLQQDMHLLERIEGFVPRIIEIKPAVNLPILSELKQQLEIAQKLASVG